jgi:hypothetical protein
MAVQVTTGVALAAARSLVPVITAAGPLAVVVTVAGAGVLIVYVWSRSKGPTDNSSHRSDPASDKREAVMTEEFKNAEIDTPVIRVTTSSITRTTRFTEKHA